MGEAVKGTPGFMQLWGSLSTVSWGLPQARARGSDGSGAMEEGHGGAWEWDAGGKKQPVGSQLCHPGRNGCYNGSWDPGH